MEEELDKFNKWFNESDLPGSARPGAWAAWEAWYLHEAGE